MAKAMTIPQPPNLAAKFFAGVLCGRNRAGMAACVALALVPLCFDAARAEQPQAVAVGTAIAELKPIEKALDFVGRVEAVNRVEVRARVKGFLEAVEFKEGDLIKAGAPLFLIEKGLFEADVQQAEGAKERDTAAKALSAIQLNRAEELLTRQAGTTVARDQARAADQEVQGRLTSDEANLTTAKINLSYTEIKSPIDGKVGKTNFTAGNVVGPESGPLTVVVSQDPMYVSFPVSQREFLRVQASGDKVDVGKIKAKLKFSDGSIYDQVGTINFIDVTVDKSTDTVLVRASFPNPNGRLIDGQLVRVALESGQAKEKVVVPQSALIADQSGTYVFVVEDGKAVVKRVKIGGELGANSVVDEGLAGGEQVIVEGLQSLRPGTPVLATPVPATLGRS
jgi:membrane fusion protein (multidrug efflux system)